LDDLRIALLIAGIVVVAGIYAFTRLSRRKSATGGGEPDLIARAPRDDDADVYDDGASLDPRPTGHGAGTDADVGDLGGVFAARRETSDAELSVDVSILAGLRASWESTLDGTIEDSAPSARFAPTADPGDSEPLAIDMSRPLVYLTLVSRQERLSGRVILDALDDEGFRPGMMQLYYWRSGEDPSVTFGVANMVEPGVLEPDSLLETETPGLVTFMSVPEDGAYAFRILDTMIANSRRLARRIDATLCDETRSTLTAQAENHLREKIADILRQSRIQD
jgi:cell division protein ZipA